MEPTPPYPDRQQSHSQPIFYSASTSSPYFVNPPMPFRYDNSRSQVQYRRRPASVPRSQRYLQPMPSTYVDHRRLPAAVSYYPTHQFQRPPNGGTPLVPLRSRINSPNGFRESGGLLPLNPGTSRSPALTTAGGIPMQAERSPTPSTQHPQSQPVFRDIVRIRVPPRLTNEITSDKIEDPDQVEMGRRVTRSTAAVSSASSADKRAADVPSLPSRQSKRPRASLADLTSRYSDENAEASTTASAFEDIESNADVDDTSAIPHSTSQNLQGYTNITYGTEQQTTDRPGAKRTKRRDVRSYGRQSMSSSKRDREQVPSLSAPTSTNDEEKLDGDMKPEGDHKTGEEPNPLLQVNMNLSWKQDLDHLIRFRAESGLPDALEILSAEILVNRLSKDEGLLESSLRLLL